MARFDKTSHIIPSYQLTIDTCNTYATEPVDGCSAHWAGSAAAKAAAKERKAKRKHRRKGSDPEGSDPSGGTAPGPSTPSTQLPSLPKLPDLPPLPGGIKPPQLPGNGSGDRDDSAEKLLDFLMGK
jgi:hypothetical protein